MLLKAGPFKAGDVVNVRDLYGKPHRAEIVCFRYETADSRTGRQALVADIVRDDGKAPFVFLTSLTEWNPERLAYLGPEAG